MLKLLGLLSYVVAAVSKEPADAEGTFVLVTVLFYKDNKEQIMIASGPIPITVKSTIMDYISLRVKNPIIKFVPIFSQQEAVPKSFDVLEFIQEKYKSIFVTEIPNKLRRNFLNDMWEFVTGKHKRHVTHMRAHKLNPKGVTTMENAMINYKTYKPLTTKLYPDIEAVTLKVVVIKVTETTTVKIVPTISQANKNTTISSTAEAIQEAVSDPYAEFIPNDIFYNIEKKCVNWADNCQLTSDNFMNISSKYFKYISVKPKIVHWSP